MRPSREYEFRFQIRCREVAKDREIIEAQFAKRFADRYLTMYERMALRKEYQHYRWNCFVWNLYVWTAKLVYGWRTE